MSVGIVLVGVFFVLLCLRVPVAAAMGLASIVGMLYAGFGISMFTSVFYAAVAKCMLAFPGGSLIWQTPVSVITGAAWRWSRW